MEEYHQTKLQLWQEKLLRVKRSLLWAWSNSFFQLILAAVFCILSLSLL